MLCGANQTKSSPVSFAASQIRRRRPLLKSPPCHGRLQKPIPPRVMPPGRSTVLKLSGHARHHCRRIRACAKPSNSRTSVYGSLSAGSTSEQLRGSNVQLHLIRWLARCGTIWVSPISELAASPRLLALLNAPYGSTLDRLTPTTILPSHLDHLGRKGPALGAYEAAVKLEPRRHEAQFRLGQLYFALGRREPAEASFRAAAAAAAGSPHAAVCGACAADAAGDEETALNLLGEAIIANPENGIAHLMLGEMLAQAGQSAKQRFITNAVSHCDRTWSVHGLDLP